MNYDKNPAIRAPLCYLFDGENVESAAGLIIVPNTRSERTMQIARAFHGQRQKNSFDHFESIFCPELKVGRTRNLTSRTYTMTPEKCTQNCWRPNDWARCHRPTITSLLKRATFSWIRVRRTLRPCKSFENCKFVFLLAFGCCDGSGLNWDSTCWFSKIFYMTLSQRHDLIRWTSYVRAAMTQNVY